MASRRRASCSRGTALIEFGLVMVIMIPLFFGMVLIGISSTASIQAVQLTRDMGHMYSLGVDFANGATQSQAQNLAQNLDLSSTGNGVVMLSQIKKVYQADCDAQGLATCPNLLQYVITQRLTLGNPTVRSSTFGTPNAGYINAQGNISAANYLTQSSLIAANAATLLPGVPAGNSVYVSESHFNLPGLSYLSHFGLQVNGVYSICYF